MSPRIDQLKTLLVDDELPARKLLTSLLERLGVESILSTDSAESAIPLLMAQEKPDVLFLDIEMPGMNGFDLIERVGIEHLPPTIFVTAYDQFAVRAFEVNAVDYLLKPYSVDRLRTALEKVTTRRQRERLARARPRLSRLIAQWDEHAGDPSHTSDTLLRLPLKNGRVLDAIPIRSIEWFLAADHYLTVAFGGKRELVYGQISDMERRLDPTQFVRIHRRCIINMAHVVSIRSESHGRYSVLMRDGTALPMSRLRTFQLGRLLSAKA